MNSSHASATFNINARKYYIYALPRCNSKEHLQNVRRYAQVNINLILSDMADSGLETSSVSPQENTASENSNTDFEESKAAEYISANEELEKINVKQTDEDHKTLISTKSYDTSYNNSEIGCHTKDLVKSTILKCTSNDHTNVTCSSLHIEHQYVNPSTSSTENDQKVKLHADEIFQYENQVLSEPFYESDCGSNENESFEFIQNDPDANASSLSAGINDKESTKYEMIEKLQDGILHNNRLQVKDVETAEHSESEFFHSSDLNKQKNSSSTSSYYFIDASTLNDEMEILTSTSQSKCSDIKPQLQGFLPTECASNNLLKDQSCKSMAFKMANLQVDYDKIAENKLKCTEYLQSVSELYNIKSIGSMSEKKINMDKGTEKEFLNVEIKEVDSGESAYPSPSVDNNVNLNNDKQEVISGENNEQTTGKVVKDTKIQESEKRVNSTENTDRPTLIRRNTFELDSNDEKLSILRQEYERRQGNLVFQNSIPQYSGHRVDGDSLYDLTTEITVPPLNDVLNKFTLAQVPTTTNYVTSYLPSDNCKCEIDQRQTQSENNYLLANNIEKSTVTYPVTKSASDRVLMNCCTSLSNVSNNCSNSLPVTLNYTLEKGNQIDLTKRSKRDEATPIISGGVSTSDYSKPTDSPSVRRKTESTPIVSGGSVIMNEPETKIKSSRMSSSMTAWIVDMSDCAKTNETKSSTTSNSYINMSHSFSVSECIKRPIRKLNGNNEKHSSLGFFVNLKDMDTKQSLKQDCSTEKKESNGDSRPYYEFYVDMSDKNHTTKYKKSEMEDVSNDKVENIAEVKDKKNIFSMFIDLSNLQETSKDESKITHRRSFPTFSDKQTESVHSNGNTSSSSSSTAQDRSLKEQKSIKEKSKPSGFMFIGLDSPVMRRRTLSSSRPTFKRHSWNVDKTQTSTNTNSNSNSNSNNNSNNNNSNNNNTNNAHTGKELTFKKEHKRAHSLSVDRGDLKKLQAVTAKSSSSNNSLNDASKADSLGIKNSRKIIQEKECNSTNMDTSSEDVFEFDVKDTPPNSHIEVINEEVRINVNHHEYKELLTNDVKKKVETVDVKAYEDEYSETSAWEKTCTESTEGGQTRKSETFDISSGSGPSPSSDNHDYELSDLLNGRTSSISDRSKVIPVGNKISETQKSLNETIKKIECELKSPEYEKLESVYNITAKTDEKISNHDSRGLYLDSEKIIPPNFVRLSDLDKTPAASHTSDILITKEERATYRMSNSIPETSWIESKLAMSRTNASLRSLPQKYTTIMSTSLPPKQKSPLEELTGECEAEGIISESDLSSMQSSMGRSGAGSTEETETSSLAGGKPYNRLGEDLLRMFLEEINPDITIDVAGRRIRAHKCILSSRCQYFAAILSGGWIESAGNVISLQGYSYNAVHFALCHIYSGESNIPDSISIVELATLADMLCLEGLKEVIGYTLKVKYCHLFHKPCQICAVGVLECMPLAAAYGLDEVYRKSLRWITRHFVRIWPCKAFATLPKELMEKCYHQHIVHMSADSVLQTMMDCDKLLATLPNVRWAEPVFKMVSNLLETSVKFLSDNFSGVLGNENFQSLGLELTWNISRLEDHFLAAAEHLPPEQACKSYTKLHKMLIAIQTDDSQGKIKWGSLFIDFLKKIQSRVEKCLVRDAARASRTTTWLKMDLELRRRIQELACLVILPHEAGKRQSRHSNFLKEPKVLSNHSTSRTLDLKRVKMAISEHNDKALKQVQTTIQNKKVLNKPKSDPLERKMQEDKQHIFDTSVRPKSWPNKIEVKSRYLEPRNKPIPKETTQQTYQEKVIVQQRRKIMISSSDSSRTSSPAMKRATEKKPVAKVKLPIKKDVKALSSDSLTESNVSKTNRKSLISKSCGITRPESPSFKQKVTEIGLSVDSLAESKNKSVPVKKKIIKMDTSMSTDSLMTEVVATPKSSTSNKLSPTLNKGTNKQQIYDKTKKNSPPILQRNPLTMTRRPQRSLENSTAASRSRAAAINTYHGSPSLRRNLLDAAKTPDIPNKSLNNMTYKTLTTRQVAQSTTAFPNARREKKENSSNQQNSESPSKRSSPKSSSTNKSSRSVIVNKRTICKGIEDKGKLKCHNGEAPKQLSVGSRSGTFLKDEPTILKKVDIKSTQINT